MTERSREQIHHMKMATLKDWLLNIEQDYINMHVDSDSPSNATSASSLPPPPRQQEQDMSDSDFEFYKEEKKQHSAASSSDELFLERKLLPLDAIQKNRLNNTATAAIDGPRSLSSIENRAIPHTIGSADSSDVISPQHSRRFSSSDLNISECMFCEFPAADSTKRSWSLRLKESKQSKNSWLVQKIKASRSFIKSLFTNSASSDKDKSCRCSDSTADNTVGSARKDAVARKSSFENLETINKSLHDDISGFGSRRRRSSFSGVLKRHFSSKGGSNLIMTSAAAAAAPQSHDDDMEKSVDAAIAHCKLSLQKGSELRIAPKVSASGNRDVASPAKTLG